MTKLNIVKINERQKLILMDQKKRNNSFSCGCPEDIFLVEDSDSLPWKFLAGIQNDIILLAKFDAVHVSNRKIGAARCCSEKINY